MLFANQNNVHLVVTYFVVDALMIGRERIRNFYDLSVGLAPATAQEIQSQLCQPELSLTSTMILTLNAQHARKWWKWVIYQPMRKNVEELNALILQSVQAMKIKKLKPKDLYAQKNVNFFWNSCKNEFIVGKLKEILRKCMRSYQNSHRKFRLLQINN